MLASAPIVGSREFQPAKGAHFSWSFGFRRNMNPFADDAADSRVGGLAVDGGKG